MSMIFGVCAIIQSVIVMKNLYETLQLAQTEEELKNLFGKYVEIIQNLCYHTKNLR